MTMRSADFDYLRNLIREQSAIILEPGKEYLIESRLMPLVRKEGLPSLDALIANLRVDRQQAITRKVVEAMTTNETSFFRDIYPFEALRDSVLPEIISRRGAQQRIRIWSAASSSGQEAYTIAMILQEHFPDQAKRFEILCTDLSTEMLERTRNGIYSQLEINRGLPLLYLTKYFEKKGLDWQVKDELRNMIDIQELNLAGNWRMIPQSDIVFMRNVLIYFDLDVKRSILEKVRQVLRSDGYLFLGNAETASNLDENYIRIQIDKTSCFQIGKR